MSRRLDRLIKDGSPYAGYAFAIWVKREMTFNSGKAKEARDEVEEWMKNNPYS